MIPGIGDEGHFHDGCQVQRAPIGKGGQGVVLGSLFWRASFMIPESSTTTSLLAFPARAASNAVGYSPIEVSYCHGARGGSGIMRRIVGSARDRVMYVEDHAAYGLDSAASGAWEAVPCGLNYVGNWIGRWV